MWQAFTVFFYCTWFNINCLGQIWWESARGKSRSRVWQVFVFATRLRECLQVCCVFCRVPTISTIEWHFTTEITEDIFGNNKQTILKSQILSDWPLSFYNIFSVFSTKHLFLTKNDFFLRKFLLLCLFRDQNIPKQMKIH